MLKGKSDQVIFNSIMPMIILGESTCSSCRGGSGPFENLLHPVTMTLEGLRRISELKSM